MRSRVTRLTGLIAGAALVISPLAAAGPAQAADDPDGTVNISIVDDQGKPVTGVVLLVPERGEQEGPVSPIIVSGDERAESSYSRPVPPGKYGIVTMGGWPLVSCAGLTTCTFMSEEDLELAGGGAFTVPAGGVVNYKVTTASPKLSGAGKVGAPLFVDVPPVLDGDLASFLPAFGELGLFMGEDMLEPTVTWKRNGAVIRKETGTEYVPTSADTGTSITAEVKFSPLLRMMFSGGSGGPFGAPGVLPAPATLGPIAIAKRDTATDVQVVGKRQVGKAPSAWFTVASGEELLNGWITVTGAANKPLRLRLYDGFAKVNLQQLRAGNHTITATYSGDSTFNASSDSVTFSMKKAKSAKPGKKKNHKKNHKKH